MSKPEPPPASVLSSSSTLNEVNSSPPCTEKLDAVSPGWAAGAEERVCALRAAGATRASESASGRIVLPGMVASEVERLDIYGSTGHRRPGRGVVRKVRASGFAAGWVGWTNGSA